MSVLRLIQFTDPHLYGNETETLRGIATLPALMRTLDVAQARDWPVDAKLVPNAATIAALVFAALNLATEVFAPSKAAEGSPALEQARAGLGIVLPHAPDLAPPLVRGRALRYFAWLAGLYAAAVLIGFVPAIAVFVMLIMRAEFAERWPVALVAAAAVTAFLWGIFDRLLAVPWPPSLLGDALPWLRQATGLV